MKAKSIKSALAILLAVAATTMPVLGETINMDFGYGTNYWLQADGWNRASLSSGNWGIGHAYTPWTNNLINSEGELTGVRLRVTQPVNTWRENTSPYELTGDAKKLFGTVAAGKAANFLNEASDMKFGFLGLDTNKFYKITVFCSKKATGTATNGFYLNRGRTTIPPLETSVLNIVPFANGVANTSEVYWHTNKPYYVASLYAGALGNISTTILTFDFVRVSATGTGALNALILESLPPPPSRVTVLVLR